LPKNQERTPKNSGEQTLGIEQVCKAVAQMDQVTQQNAALVEQSVAAATTMREEASALVRVVSTFKIDGAQGRLSAPANREPGRVSFREENLAAA
jgi:methyl-accepting chemotaxis protein